jgi:NAD(P)-dependent dehydrogenase (short-subunit alcohol dehydrogenase family)
VIMVRAAGKVAVAQLGPLAGQVAVVTGSGGAMGGAIAERLAAAGVHIVLNDRVADRVDAHRAAVEAHGVEAVSVTASTSRPDGARTVIAAALDTWGRLDILVNTVGGIKGPIEVPVWEITDEHWNGTLAVSLTATFLCTREAARVMIGQRSGKIVNIASTSWAPPHSALHPHYAAAKAGVVAFTRAVALQLAAYDVNVNAVAPGATRRDAAVVDDGAAPLPPLGRINDPADIAGAVAYLVSPDARNVSGQLITVAGGLNPAL